AAAALTGKVGILPGIPPEHRLPRADLHITPREDHVAVFGNREGALQRGVELRSPRGHRGELVLFGPFERREEVKTILDDRTADGSAELMPAVVRLRCAARVVLFLLESVHRVEALVAEVLEHFTAEQVRPALG